MTVPICTIPSSSEHRAGNRASRNHLLQSRNKMAGHLDPKPGVFVSSRLCVAVRWCADLPTCAIFRDLQIAIRMKKGKSEALLRLLTRGCVSCSAASELQVADGHEESGLLPCDRSMACTHSSLFSVMKGYADLKYTSCFFDAPDLVLLLPLLSLVTLALVFFLKGLSGFCRRKHVGKLMVCRERHLRKLGSENLVQPDAELPSISTGQASSGQMQSPVVNVLQGSFAKPSHVNVSIPVDLKLVDASVSCFKMQLLVKG